MDSALIGGLKSTNLSRFQNTLAAWGIHTPSDLLHLSEWDCWSLGMTRLQARKLLSLAPLKQTMECAAPEQQIDVTADRCDIHDLADAVTEAEGDAHILLEKSLNIALSLLQPEHVFVQETLCAMQSLAEPPQLPSQAMKALYAVSRAVAFCPDQNLRAELCRAKQAIRDVLVWRVQKEVTRGGGTVQPLLQDCSKRTLDGLTIHFCRSA